MDGLNLAILLIMIGLFFLGAVPLLLRMASRIRPRLQPVIVPGSSLLPDHGDAVMIVETGGRIRSMNQRARQIFQLQDGEIPSLERLARRIRPNEVLLKLCSAEGQARFVLDGRLVEGTSYRVEMDDTAPVVVSLRYPELTAGGVSKTGGLSASTLQTFTQLTQEMASSLELEKTLEAVLSNIEKLMPAELMEITIWDAEAEVFIPYRYSGMPGLDRKLEMLHNAYPVEGSYTGRLYKTRVPLLIADVEASKDYSDIASYHPIVVRSFLGFPLMVADEFIGTLEMGSSVPDAFHTEDVDLVRLLSGQAAIALHNAMLYSQEQQRAAELSGLARLTQAFSSVRDPGGLITRLVESIKPLIQVEILGFLIYNENSRILEARLPFHGLPDQMIDLYRAQILPGSTAEQLLISQELLLTENAQEDEKWAHLGLTWLSQAASLRETALVPLTTGGHMLGYLQVSNHTAGPMAFSQPELHLLTIVANQSASIIENANLVQQSRQRAQRAEALRRIASLASSAATLDEILQYSLQELARLLRADIAAIFLVNQDRALMELHRSSVFSNLPSLPERLAHIMVDDPQFHFTVTGSQHVLLSGHLSEANKPIVPFYQSILNVWEIESLVAVPLVVRNDGIGELWFGSKGVDFFDQGDVQVVATAAGQLAGVAEQAFLSSQTDESLRRRVEQMTAITRISRELSTSLDLNYLLQLVYDEALRTTGADCGTILLFKLDNPDGIQPVGDAPSIRFFVGDMPDDSLSPLQLMVLENDAPQLIPDFSRSDFQPPHDGVQSILVVPISYQQRHAGLICLHGRHASQFDQTSMEITQSLAVQAAVALNNALAYEEQTQRSKLLKRELDTLSHLTTLSRTLHATNSLQQSLHTIADSLVAATPFQVALISVYDPVSDGLRRVVGVGMAENVWEQLRSRLQPWQGVQPLLQPQFRVGGTYYIPADKKPATPENVQLVNVLPAVPGESQDHWHADDILLVPLFDSQSRPLGLISLDAPRDMNRPDRPTFEALELFAGQAALVIESSQHTNSLQNQLTDLESERARLELAANQAQSNLPMLLRKDLEQSMALHGLNQRIDRVRASLEISAQANRQESREAILHTLASELMTRFAMQAALIAEHNPDGIRLVEVVGTFPPAANPDALFGQRNPLRHMLQAPKSPETSLMLVASLDNTSEWHNSTLMNVLEARSMIGMQIDAGTDETFGVLVIGQRALSPFLDEDRRVFTQLAYQVSMGLKNLQLLNETRRRLSEVNLLLDFSRKLGSLQPAEILSNLIESIAQVVPNADAGWVGMWEERELAIIPQVAFGYTSLSDILGIHYGIQLPNGEIVDTRVVLPLRVFRTGRSERIAEIDFGAQYHLTSNNLMRYRRATGGRLPLSALLIPLRIGENVLGVVCFENFKSQDAFTQEDEDLAYSFTNQAAMALENARLYQASEQRATQLQALTMVAGTITSSLQREELIALLLDQLKIVVPYDTATLWLRQSGVLTVAAATGFADNDLRLNLSVNVEDSLLFTTMIKTTEPVSVGDVRNDRRFPMLVEPENLSWLGIPLIYKSEVIGLIALEKKEADYYSSEAIQAATTYAGQAAVSLENARLFGENLRRAAELDERSQRLALLNRLSAELVASLDVEHILGLTGQQLVNALATSGASAIMLNQAGQYILEVEVPGRDVALPIVLPATPLFDHLRESQGVFVTSEVMNEGGLVPLSTGYLRERKVRSLLVVPLTSGPSMLGWFLLYNSEGYRYASSEIELARTICNQAAIAIQNALLFAETRRLTEDLERRVEERTHELRREHKNSQTLLHIITELSTSLDMSLVLNRTLTVLNESVGAEESNIVLSQGSNVQYRAGMALTSQLDASKNPPVERQIAKWVIRSRQPVIISRVASDGRWEVAPDALPAYQSVLAVPLVMGEEILGALLLFHRQGNFFGQELISLIEATARQIGIALNNAELFNLIRDQSEHLGSMLREQQIEASRSRAILEAVADGVLVTDAQGRINLFNASAERILELKSGEVMSKALDQFVGLFGKSTSEWMQTISNWSQDPLARKSVETYAERIDLDNGRIVSVHLAPVFWRQEFLGTVSIFRDITHEVQVDRLKSEFVANVSHELRTPMTSIKGYVEIMLMGATGSLSPQQVHFLQIVKSNTERLSVLVNDLLDVSRIEAGRLTLNLMPLDMHEIVEDVMTDIKRRCKEENRPMNFEVNIASGLPFALGDAERVRQILGNLVSNGYNYTPENGCVNVSIKQVEQHLQVDVADNGIGIHPAEQHRIFERFYRGEDPLVLASAGFGLGLAIARSLVEMHHGKIWFSSNGIRGEGSKFSFTLPVAENQE